VPDTKREEEQRKEATIVRPRDDGSFVPAVLREGRHQSFPSIASNGQSSCRSELLDTHSDVIETTDGAHGYIWYEG